MSDATPTPPRLRVTSGPLRGATFPLIDGLVIGRSPNVDILVLAPGVRPRHAEIRETGKGRFMLTAIDEGAELRARGGLVRRIVLSDGVEFELAGSRFECAATQPTRPQCEYAAGRGEVLSDRATLPGRRLPRVLGPVPHSAYPWPLVGDVVKVRKLRAQSGHGKALGTDDAAELQRLVARLSLGFQGARPRFLEFAVDAPAVLRFGPDADAPGLSVRARRLGVEGVRVRCDVSMVQAGQRVWIEVRPEDPRDATAIFAGRIDTVSASGVRIAFVSPDEELCGATAPLTFARLRSA